MLTNNEQLIKTIVELEIQLRELKLELQNNEEDNYTNPIEVGEEVIILNPRKGQENSGVVVKLHRRTKRATIVTTNKRGGEEKVVRLLTNIERK
mgnify:FL=1|jgi:hypothetical protein